MSWYYRRMEAVVVPWRRQLDTGVGAASVAVAVGRRPSARRPHGVATISRRSIGEGDKYVVDTSRSLEATIDVWRKWREEGIGDEHWGESGGKTIWREIKWRAQPRRFRISSNASKAANKSKQAIMKLLM